MGEYTTPTPNGSKILFSLSSKNRGMEGTIFFGTLEIQDSPENLADLEEIVNVVKGYGFGAGLVRQASTESQFVPEPIVPDEPEGPPGGV